MRALANTPLRRYLIERYLTEGGMGAIYRGKRLGAGGFEKEVVLKQLLPEFTSRPEFRDLFFREAKISASLDHVNIVRTYDLVRSDDALFIVMEYVPGTDLRTISWRARQRRRELSPAAILHIGQEILAGLAYAHGRTDREGKPLGIIHRDVSPSNILCSGEGDVKLSDFGIAKATSFASVFYRVRGKVGYMSPEQARTLPIDHRSDLYSMAVCLVETFIGERLFVGDLQTPVEQVYARALPALSERCPAAPPGLDAVFARALAPEPEGRYQTAAEFSQALREIARQAGMLYSAPALAAELKELLGPDSERWSQSDYVPFSAGETERLPMSVAGQDGRETEDAADEWRPPGAREAHDQRNDQLLGKEASPVAELRTQPLRAATPERGLQAVSGDVQDEVVRRTAEVMPSSPLGPRLPRSDTPTEPAAPQPAAILHLPRAGGGGASGPALLPGTRARQLAGTGGTFVSDDLPAAFRLPRPLWLALWVAVGLGIAAALGYLLSDAPRADLHGPRDGQLAADA